MARERIVIVGASLAGARAAAGLREEGFDGEILLIGAEPRLPCHRPPLSKGYLRGAAQFEAQLIDSAASYAERDILLRLGVRATAVDAGRKLVWLDGGEQVSYSRLLVATGGRNRSLSVPGAGLEGVFQLRDHCPAVGIVGRADVAPRVRGPSAGRRGAQQDHDVGADQVELAVEPSLPARPEDGGPGAPRR
jgi:3-phenylpropionate/trans-cinnamate dioxygenase ferredoxin reductase subunit